MTRPWYSFDLETHLLQPGLAAPPIVCGSFASGTPQCVEGRLLTKVEAIEYGRHLLGLDAVIAGANIAYDFLCLAVAWAQRGEDIMPLIFKAYKDGRVFDVLLAEGLHAIAEGTLGKDPRTGRPLQDPEDGSRAWYSLATVSDIVLARAAKANDAYRFRYAELEHVPMQDWPLEARIYPVDDAVNTLDLAYAQLKRNKNLHDLPMQCFKAWALHLAGAWGFRADPAGVAALEAAALELGAVGQDEFIAAGFVRPSGKKNNSVIKRAVATAYGCTGTCYRCTGSGIVPSPVSGKPVNCPPCNGTGLDLDTAPVPRTEPTEIALAKAEALGETAYGNVQIGRDVLIESGDEFIMSFGQAQEDNKVTSTYLPWLKQGTERPITLRPNTLLETGRVSYSGPVQLLPRSLSTRLVAKLKASGAPVTGVRDCLQARPGWLFYSNDYGGGELVTFSEACVERVGFSDMGQALNGGADVHALLGAQMLGVSADEFMRRRKANDKQADLFRQAAKPGNFMFPGGGGTAKFALTQRKQGPDTEWEGGPVDLGDGRMGYKGLRPCLLLGMAPQCGTVKVTEWKKRACPPICKQCIIASEEIRSAWFKAWGEARPYLDWHSRNVDRSPTVVQLYSKRIRGGNEFCSEANGDFQALLADIAGRAQIRVSEEQYCDKSSPLYGSRSIVFAHDELFGEARADVAAEVSERVNELMVEEFKKGCPNHAAACKAEPTLMARWHKAAKPVRDERGRLVPWEPS